jgi:putative sugar O-methyltransferase
MDFCFLNPPLVSGVEQQRSRAQAALEILKTRTDTGDSLENRWKVWIDMHRSMYENLSVDSLLEFQSHPMLGPQITGGSGKHFLSFIAENFGYQELTRLLKNHSETLCGKPKDMVNEQGAYITITSMRHLYHVAQLRSWLSFVSDKTLPIVEIGGGFGNLARMAIQQGVCSRYFIVDHPVMQCIQYYFLTEFFTPEEIAIVTGNGEYLTGSSASKIQLYSSLGYQSLKSVLRAPYALVSTLALTEISGSGQRQYLDYFKPAFIYVYGQFENAAIGPAGKSGKEMQFSNKELVCGLAQEFHTLMYKYYGYHFEYIGRSR